MISNNGPPDNEGYGPRRVDLLLNWRGQPDRILQKRWPCSDPLPQVHTLNFPKVGSLFFPSSMMSFHLEQLWILGFFLSFLWESVRVLALPRIPGTSHLFWWVKQPRELHMFWLGATYRVSQAEARAPHLQVRLQAMAYLMRKHKTWIMPYSWWLSKNDG